MNLKCFVTNSLVFVLAAIGFLASVLNAQEEPLTGSSAPTLQTPEDSSPEFMDDSSTVYLRDADGQPIAVPRLQYQQFYDYLQKQYESAQSGEDVASLEGVEVRGTVVDEFVEVKVTLVATIKEQLVAPASIPIQFSNLIIKSTESVGPYISRLAPNKTTEVISNVGTTQDANALQNSNLTQKTNPLLWVIQPRFGVSEAENALPAKCQFVILGYLPVTSSALKQVTLDLPSAASQVRIQLPRTAQDITWMGESNQKINEENTDQGIEVERVGLGDYSQLAWRDVGDVEESLSTEINSNTRFVANAEGRPWIATTKLSLKPGSIPSARDFVIQLPENATWSPAIDSNVRGGWTVTPYPQREGVEPTNKGMSNRLLLRASAEELSRSSSSIEIRWNWQPPEKLDQDFALQTITVENAERHEGTIEVLLPSNIQFSWKADRTSGLSKRLIEPGTPELFNYAFSFTKTPVQILCNLRQSGYRLEYRPEFLVQLKNSSMELTGLLNFAVDPSQMVGLEINLGKWAVKQVTWAQSGQPIDFQQVSPGLIRFDPAGLYHRTDSSSISSASSLGRTMQLDLVRNYQATDDPQKPIGEISLPSIEWLDDQGKSVVEVGNGWITVSSDDWYYEKSDVKLQSLTAVEKLPSGISGLIESRKLNTIDTYLFTQAEGEPIWRARLNRKPNLATQFVETQMTFDEASYRLRKTWKIEQNKWKDLSFAFYLPESIAQDLVASSPASPKDRRSIFTMDGVRVQCEKVSESTYSNESEKAPSKDQSTEATGAATIGDEVASSLPKPVEGWTVLRPILEDLPTQFELKLDVVLPITQDNARTPTESISLQVDIPYLIASSPLMTIDRQFDVSVESTWRAILNANEQEVVVLPGQTMRPRKYADSVFQLEAVLEKLSTVERSAVQVHQIWLQTALNGSERMDRCVFDLTTAADQLELELNASDINNLTSVLVNGQRIDPQRIEGTFSLVLMLDRISASQSDSTLVSPAAKSIAGSSVSSEASQAKPKRYTVELWLWSTVSQNLFYRVTENIPSIVNAKEPAPKYWQLIVPQQDHLWTKSSSLLPEYQWRWSGLTLRRETELRQAELEQMMQASEQAEFGLDANRYLFSSLAVSLDPTARSAQQSVYIVPRYALFAPVGLLCILIACALVYFPWLRSVWVAGLMTLCGLAVAAVSIDMALMLLQSVAGASLFVAALILVHWSISRRVDQRSVFANRSRMTTSTVTPVAPVDFGGDEMVAAQQNESVSRAAHRKSNSAIGTTRSLQAAPSNDPDVTVDHAASVPKPVEETIEGAT